MSSFRPLARESEKEESVRENKLRKRPVESRKGGAGAAEGGEFLGRVGDIEDFGLT